MERKAWLVAGLGFGDEGKGATVDYLVRKNKATLVVRYNGGAQAAHNVVLHDGTHHTFAQFGSGTFAGAHTHLSRHVIIEPRAMMNEAKHLEELGINPWEKLTVEGGALVITPFQRAASRIIERARKFNKNEHGSCGLGIGHTRADHLKFGNDVVFARDLKGDKKVLEKKLRFLQRESIHSIPAIGSKGSLDSESDWATLGNEWAVQLAMDIYNDWPAMVVDTTNANKTILMHDNIVFEGAQGMMLDEKFGTAPHNTWTDITFTNANEILAESGFSGLVRCVGVIRSYYTRHGAGPFPTEDKTMNHPEPHNDASGFQGAFRQGAFDWKSFNYALRAIGGVDMLAVNHLDLMEDSKKRVEFLMDLVSRSNVVPVICGMGPTYERRISMSPEYQYRRTLEELLHGPKPAKLLIEPSAK